MNKKKTRPIKRDIKKGKERVSSYFSGSSLEVCTKLEQFPPDSQTRSLLALDLLTWVSKTKSLEISDWAIEKGFAFDSVWRCDDPYFKSAYKQAKLVLASSMRHLEIKGKMKWEHTKYMLPHYNNELRESLKEDSNTLLVMRAETFDPMDTMGIVKSITFGEPEKEFVTSDHKDEIVSDSMGIVPEAFDEQT